MMSLIALALAQSLAGGPAPDAASCPLDRIREPARHGQVHEETYDRAHAPRAEHHCRVVLVDPVPAAAPSPCHVDRAPQHHPRTDCERIRLYDETRYERREHHASSERRETRSPGGVRAGDAITLGAIGVATLDGGVGRAGAPVIISHGGSVFVSSSSSAFASSSASAQASASAHVRFSGGRRGGGGGHHGGGHHGGH